MHEINLKITLLEKLESLKDDIQFSHYYKNVTENNINDYENQINEDYEIQQEVFENITDF